MIWHDRSHVGEDLDARPIIQHSIRCRKPRGRRLDIVLYRVEETTVGGLVEQLEWGGIIVLAVGVTEVDTTVANSVESEREVLWIWRCDLLEPGELRWIKDE